METTINNVYDYSTVIPVIEKIGTIVQFLDGVYSHFMNLSKEEEERNSKLKEEYQEYKYRNRYSFFEINIRKKIDDVFHSDYVTCKNLESFKKMYDEGNLINMEKLEIKMSLSFARGKGYFDNEKYDNDFSIVFEPYNIKFIRKSNYEDPEIDEIEKRINEIFNSFDKCNTIFCSK